MIPVTTWWVGFRGYVDSTWAKARRCQVPVLMQQVQRSSCNPTPTKHNTSCVIRAMLAACGNNSTNLLCQVLARVLQAHNTAPAAQAPARPAVAVTCRVSTQPPAAAAVARQQRVCCCRRRRSAAASCQLPSSASSAAFSSPPAALSALTAATRSKPISTSLPIFSSSPSELGFAKASVQ